ncbi:MAG TPA: methyltransferase domain-containing protein [Longimicrobium sp.]|jgi:SAM-dependent methyltransferase
MTGHTIAPGDAEFVGSIPELYDRYLGPMLFEGYAADLASRLRLPSSPLPAVLEVAAGTGILTERLLEALPANATLTVTDLNAPMLDVARRRVGGAASDAVTWQVADAMALPFEDASFDAVACQFGAMFFPDKRGAARETLRVLRPGGQWLFSVWGAWDENPFGEIVHRTVERFFPADPPGFYRVPFSFADPAALRPVVEGAGFEELEIVELDRVAESPSARDAAVGLVRGNPLIAAIEERGTVDAEEVVQALAEALAARFGDHPLRHPTRIRVVSARRPS